ncbi:MAG: hypothetical protein IPJ90_12055 [Anaerolineaceae bacterium]|nr:hypothetical protein [Anaerolineaceae bacterium]
MAKTRTKGAGRPPRRATAMPKTAITAHVDQFIFFQLLSGEQNTVSAGIQKAVGYLTNYDEVARVESQECWKQTEWMVNRAKTALGKELDLPHRKLSQEQILTYVKDNIFDLKQEYVDAQRDRE